MGTATGVAQIKSNVAIISPPDTTSCKITVVFKGKQAKVTQGGMDTDCGFGANVTADGVYIKRSNKPKFEKDDN